MQYSRNLTLPTDSEQTHSVYEPVKIYVSGQQKERLTCLSLVLYYIKCTVATSNHFSFSVVDILSTCQPEFFC